jgi:glutaredoxin
MKFASTSSMRRSAYLALGLTLLVSAGGARAQIHKWVDANGKTHFSDKPPPVNVKPAPIKGSTGAAGGVSLPYELATAARNFPVTLYTGSPCGGCDQGRTLLKARGIPFAEKTISTVEDEQKLKEATGATSLPVLVVGKVKSVGFQASGWTTMLNVALYPETKMLPASYQYPAAVAAAPKPPKATEPDQDAMRVSAAAAAAEADDKRRREAAKPKSPTAPPGFQF